MMLLSNISTHISNKMINKNTTDRAEHYNLHNKNRQGHCLITQHYEAVEALFREDFALYS